MNFNSTPTIDDSARNDANDRDGGPFPTNVRWSSQDLADAVRLPQPLHTLRFAPTANDALLHRPRRGMSFLPPGAARHHFRVGG